MVEIKIIRKILNRLEKYLIKQVDYRLTGNNFDLAPIHPNRKIFDRFKIFTINKRCSS